MKEKRKGDKGASGFIIMKKKEGELLLCTLAIIIVSKKGAHTHTHTQSLICFQHTPTLQCHKR